MADAAFQIALASELLPHISENEQNLAILANNLSSSFMEFYQLKKALEFQEKAIKILEVELNANHPHLATSYYNLSATYLGLNNLDSPTISA